MSRSYQFSGITTKSSPLKPFFASFIAIFLMLMVFTLSAQATQVNFQWNASTGSVAGYKLYQGTVSGTYVSNVTISGTGTTGSMDLDPAASHYVAATAYDGSQRESAFSNEILCHPVTSTAASGGTISPSGSFFAQNGSSVSFTLTPNSGYRVSSLSINGTSVGSVTSYTMSGITSGATVSAVFEPIPPVSYTLTTSSNNTTYGTVSPSGSVSVTSGGSRTITISPNTGYEITDVKVDGVSVGVVTSYTFSNVTANHTLAATFAIKTYAITVTAGSNGTISPSTTSVNHGASQAFTITPNTGYQVQDVKVDGTSQGAITSYTFTNVTATHTISATFAIKTYAITVTAGSNGTISPSTTPVNHGASQAFTITPNTGYQVQDVKVDGTSQGAITSYTFTNVTATHTISATFVQKANQAPVANAGSDQNVSEGVTVTLSGANSSDPDDGIATYSWTQLSGPQVTLSNASNVSPTFVAPNIGPEGAALEFQLTVEDFAGLSTTDTCLVNVRWVNEAPIANAGAAQTVTEGTTTVQLDGSGSTDSDDGIASYSWVQKTGSTVNLLNANTATPTFVTPNVGTGGGSLSFELTVTDKGGLKSTAQTIVNVTWVNAPPVANAGSDQVAYEGDAVTLNGSASTDPDDGIAGYSWTQVSGTPVTFLSSAASAQVAFTAPVVTVGGEVLTFRLTVTDNGGLTSSSTCAVTVSDKPGPDLTGSWGALTYKSGRVAGTVTVRNVGTLSAGAEYVSFYLSTDGQSLGKYITRKAITTIAAGQSRSLSFAYSKSGLIGKYIVAVLDSTNRVAETAEDNNRAPVVIPVMTTTK